MANRQKVNLVGRFYNESYILLNYLRMTPQEHFVLFFVFVFFVLLAAPKKNKQKELWQGHRNSCGQLQRAPILIKKERNIKRHSDTRKATATYNKLLDETRDEHYYILNR